MHSFLVDKGGCGCVFWLTEAALVCEIHVQSSISLNIAKVLRLLCSPFVN